MVQHQIDYATPSDYPINLKLCKKYFFSEEI
jgi:hypothetical protein